MSTLVRPDNPGSYMELVGETAVRPPANIGSKVAIPIVHDWGPLGKDEGVQGVETFGAFDSLFGNSATVGRDAVLGAFVGPGVPGEPGAGETLIFRMATSSAKAATKTQKNTAGSPADALVLTGIYKGTRGNRLSYVIEADPSNEANHRLRIRLDGVTQETYKYAKTNITALGEAINARSKLVKAEVKVSGTALATTTGTSLAEGNNGESITAIQWEEALNALELEDFTTFAPFDLTSAPITALVLSWVQSLDAAETPITAVLGGAASETLEEAIEAADDLRDEHVIRLGGGTFHDDFLDKDISTSKLAPRIAGILAGRGEESSLTFAPLAGLKQVGEVVVATDELALARDEGLTVFRRTSRPDADLIVAAGVTTFNSHSDTTKPYELFSDPRIVRMFDGLKRRMKEWGDTNIVGDTRVIDSTKAAVRQRGLAELGDLQGRGLINPGTSEIDRPFFRIIDDPGPDLQDAIAYEFRMQPTRTSNFLIGQGKVR